MVLVIVGIVNDISEMFVMMLITKWEKFSQKEYHDCWTNTSALQPCCSANMVSYIMLHNCPAADF